MLNEYDEIVSPLNDIGYIFADESYTIMDQLMDLELKLAPLSEIEYNNAVDHLKLEVMDIDRYIKANNWKEITNPNFFVKVGVPTSDGLLSNEIFGITQKDRSEIYAYIRLNGTFMDPSCYKVWKTIDRRIKSIVQGTQTYIINDKGDFEESPDGETGIDFLKKNFDKIKIKSTESRKRDLKIRYLEHNYKKGRMFIDKYIVIPPYYRDVNTSGAHVGVGEVNRLYSNLLRSASSLKETQDYGLPRNDVINANIQETLLVLYDWFCGNNNTGIKEEGTGISGKFGIMRRANLSKTSDYSSRLVISAPELKVESIDNLMVTLDRSAVPLAAVVADFYPFMMFHIRRFFENQLIGVSSIAAVNYKTKKIEYIQLDDSMSLFTDDVIKKELKRFLHSYNDRFRPVVITTNGTEYEMQFKGMGPDERYNKQSESIYNRSLTWTDVIYMAAVEATKDKKIILTRYPIDSFYNTVITGIVVSSTKETEPMYIGNEYYPFYPRIRKEDINSNTGNKFVDTMQFSNLYLKGMGGDYDGDQVSAKGSFFDETNKELDEYVKSKINFIGLGGENKRVSGNEAIQVIYDLTKVLEKDKSKLTDPVF